MIYDLNKSKYLVLDDTAYRPIAEGESAADVQPCDWSILKQRHYVARSATFGIFCGTAEVLDGWMKLESNKWCDNLRRLA